MTGLSGTGIHSGAQCSVRLFRSEGPVQFIRAGQRIPAASEAVSSTRHCTTLGTGTRSVAMVEHLLAALHATGFWSGVSIEVTAAELPILDGSAEPWLELISELGEPPAAPLPLRPAGPVRVEAAGGWAEYRPGAASLTVEVDFAHPAIGKQAWSGTSADYGSVLAARTFGFLADFEQLKAHGLALGANLDNALVFGDTGALQEQRFPDEPARHKVLDALGDLFLLQAPLGGEVRISSGSHALHHSLVTKLGSVLQESS
jgi:UDP-3-O-[3-hydroxymyristoyl] N-acetylglucosamine deacetylase